jgi:hypothetical protein
VFEPVVAYLLSIVVTLPAIDSEVEAKEEDTVDDVLSRFVTLIDKLADSTANEADALVKVVILVSSVVRRVDIEPLYAANEADACVLVEAVASVFVTLVDNEAEAAAYEPEVTTKDPEVRA